MLNPNTKGNTGTLCQGKWRASGKGRWSKKSGKALASIFEMKGVDCMRFTETDLGGAWVIDPSPHKDDRGRFMRAWCARALAENGLDFTPVQGNMGFSIRKGTP